MKRFLAYLLVGASLVYFNRFQETVTYKIGVVIFSSKLYTQGVGIGLAVVVVLYFFAMLLWARRAKFMRLRDLAAVGAGLFALPACWQNWNTSRFGSDGYITETTAGLGGPMAGSLFYAVAFALIAAELYMLCSQRSRGEDI
jgi:hypothetical protein